MFTDVASKPGTLLPGVLDADARTRGAAYVSALLQCAGASTPDLKDMYMAQVACLQTADMDDGEAGTYGLCWPGICAGGHFGTLFSGELPPLETANG